MPARRPARGPLFDADACLRALLARQSLLDRAGAPPERVLERVAGLQTQHAPSGHLGLWSRVSGFHRDDLDAALHDARVVQAWVMRSTIHMVSARDFPLFTAAVREARRAEWLRTHPGLAGVDHEAMAAAAEELLTPGPMRQAELTAALGERGYPRAAVPDVQLWVDLVRVPPAGTWATPRAHVYGLASTWLRRSRARAPDPEEARRKLVARYLRAFGPSSVPDVARFAGLTVTATRRALEPLPLTYFRGEDGAELVDVTRAPRPGPGTPLPVRFLGPYDAVLLLGHAARARILPAAFRDRVFATTMPRSAPTFLVGGRVAGTWTHHDGRVRTVPFADLTAHDRRAVDDEAERLREWLTG